MNNVNDIYSVLCTKRAIVERYYRLLKSTSYQNSRHVYGVRKELETYNEVLSLFTDHDYLKVKKTLLGLEQESDHDSKE